MLRDIIDNLIKGVADAVCSSTASIMEHAVSLCGIFAQNLAGM